jgi:alpha-glucosidase (family GH31 glycosyl hydrolase)
LIDDSSHEFLFPDISSCNSFQTDEKPNRRRNMFDDAKNEGMVVGDNTGAPYMIPNTSFNAAMVDLTNPAARKWFKSILHDMVKTGVRGWMADFGESLPFDSCLYSGTYPKPFFTKC